MNERRNNSNSNHAISIEETVLSLALVLRGTLKDFITIKQFIDQWTAAQIIYQTKAVGKLYITPELRRRDERDE